MKLEILEPAEQDLIRGYLFYERQAEGIGHYFLDCLYSEIDSLLHCAGIHRKQFGYYWMLSKRFPFATYYQVESEMIVVYAILDCRQDPRKRSKCLKN